MIDQGSWDPVDPEANPVPVVPTQVPGPYVHIDNKPLHGVTIPESGAETLYADTDDGFQTLAWYYSEEDVLIEADALEESRPEDSLFWTGPVSDMHVGVVRGAPLLRFGSLLVTYNGRPIRFGDET